jgi:hypothetical protein
MKSSPKKTANASSRSSGDRGRAASGSKTASNARAAKRQSDRAASDKANDIRAPAGGTAETSPSGKRRS